MERTVSEYLDADHLFETTEPDKFDSVVTYRVDYDDVRDETVVTDVDEDFSVVLPEIDGEPTEDDIYDQYTNITTARSLYDKQDPLFESQQQLTINEVTWPTLTYHYVSEDDATGVRFFTKVAGDMYGFETMLQDDQDVHGDTISTQIDRQARRLRETVWEDFVEPNVEIDTNE